MESFGSRILESVARRLGRGEYLGFHLTVGLAISLTALAVFTWLTQAVVHHSSLTYFDMSLLEWLHAHSSGVATDIFLTITAFGSPLAITTIGLVMAVVLARRRAWVLFAVWLMALVGAGVLDKVLKQAVGRPRPRYAYALHTYGFGFPSGHAIASLITYGMVAHVLITLWIDRPIARRAVVLVAACLVLLIGVSRLYLGVHYLTDVIAGYAAGAVWLSACITGLNISARNK